MNQNDYVPHPIDTSDVELTEEICELAEMLARNTHEVWAQGRMAQGWVYGEETDPVAGTHRCLIPYEDLPESEKEYDRRTSQETLRLLLKLGFEIKRK